MALFTSPSRLYNRPSHPSNPVLRPLVLVFYPPAPSLLFSFYFPFVGPISMVRAHAICAVRFPASARSTVMRHRSAASAATSRIWTPGVRMRGVRRRRIPFSNNGTILVQQPPTRPSIDTEARTSPTTTAVRRAGAGPAVRRRAAPTCALIAPNRSSLSPPARSSAGMTEPEPKGDIHLGEPCCARARTTRRENAGATPVEDGAGQGRTYTRSIDSVRLCRSTHCFAMRCSGGTYSAGCAGALDPQQQRRTGWGARPDVASDPAYPAPAVPVCPFEDLRLYVRIHGTLRWRVCGLMAEVRTARAKSESGREGGADEEPRGEWVGRSGCVSPSLLFSYLYSTPSSSPLSSKCISSRYIVLARCLFPFLPHTFPLSLDDHSIVFTSPSSYPASLPSHSFVLPPFYRPSGLIISPSLFPHFPERVFLVRARSAGVRLCTSARAAHPSYGAAARSARAAKIAPSAVADVRGRDSEDGGGGVYAPCCYCCADCTAPESGRNPMLSSSWFCTVAVRRGGQRRQQRHARSSVAGPGARRGRALEDRVYGVGSEPRPSRDRLESGTIGPRCRKAINSTRRCGTPVCRRVRGDGIGEQKVSGAGSWGLRYCIVLWSMSGASSSVSSLHRLGAYHPILVTEFAGVLRMYVLLSRE
ncbi:hypothetical protein DFH09DRAFT_1348088 [Mycena vulgaris]|nr:hypothetical protein DFH09DRAFT_1348088 [Mycena vulgaris]